MCPYMSIQGAGCVNTNSVVDGGCPYKIDRGVCNDVLCDMSIQRGRVCPYKVCRDDGCPYKIDGCV